MDKSDINPTACRITAFSLCLAYLDQLSPRDIHELRQKGHRLPRLVHYAQSTAGKIEGNIWCGDFFADGKQYAHNVDVVIGNPPWGSTAHEGTPAADWCAHPTHVYPVPDKQLATAFVWKAAHHLADTGHVYFVLPHGLLFNHSDTALEFQRTFFRRHAVDHVLILVDYQRFLFEGAGHPAIVIGYQKTPPADARHVIEYWAPKADWLATRAEVIALTPEDRCTLTVGQVLHDLEGDDAPQIWKQRYWATPRDWRLIDRLSLYARLRDHVRRAKEGATSKRWGMAEGFQPIGKSDDPAKAKTVRLPTRRFIEATSSNIDLFLLPGDCIKLPSAEVILRSGSNTHTGIFRAPHVLVAKGFTSTAFADFDVSFRHALRGISGPEEDRDLLLFLAAYLRSSLARYFVFHTSSNWGVSRQEVHVEELLRLPFPLPDMMPVPERAWEIVKEIGAIVTSATANASRPFANREDLVRAGSSSIDMLIDEYFDVLPVERALIDDTVQIVIPSVRPTRRRSNVATITISKESQRQNYTKLLCETLNEWAKEGPFTVSGHLIASGKLGIGVAVLRKTRAGDIDTEPFGELDDLFAALDRLRRVTSQKLNAFELFRGAKVFDHDRLFLIKPIGQRFWTQTAALNDADEIAGTILMHAPQAAAWP